MKSIHGNSKNAATPYYADRIQRLWVYESVKIHDLCRSMTMDLRIEKNEEKKGLASEIGFEALVVIRRSACKSWTFREPPSPF